MRDIIDIDLPHYLSMGPELTRPARGLPVWLALHLHGTDAFAAELDRVLDLAEHAVAELSAMSGVTLVGNPPLSVIAFRAADDAATEAVQQVLNDSGEVYVSSTVVAGRPHVRLALLHQCTSRAHVDAALEVIRGVIS